MRGLIWVVTALSSALLSRGVAHGQHAQHGEPEKAQPVESARPIRDTPVAQGDGIHDSRDEEPDPVLPVGRSLDQTLDDAAAGPPSSWPAPIHDNPTLSFTLFELLEYRVADDAPDEFGWDVQGWIGNDDHKFWWKSDGDVGLDGSSQGEANIRLLYARPISPFWYLQAGVRYDRAWAPGDSQDRASLVLGAQGLAPFKFDLEPELYITDDGDVLGSLTASYDLYLTQRLVLQPRTEVNVSAQDVPEYGIGAGFNDLSLELRLRFEVSREFAPYVGVRYTTLLGKTADIGRRNGETVDAVQLVVGFRIAF